MIKNKGTKYLKLGINLQKFYFSTMDMGDFPETTKLNFSELRSAII
jgi:hypothetical protein